MSERGDEEVGCEDEDEDEEDDGCEGDRVEACIVLCVFVFLDKLGSV